MSADDPKTICPYCKKVTSKWETPLEGVGEGSGWDTEFIYVCLNDECSFYVESRERMLKYYQRAITYRYMYNPESGETGSIPAI
jgi:hypothetical protein